MRWDGTSELTVSRFLMLCSCSSDLEVLAMESKLNSYFAVGSST